MDHWEAHYLVKWERDAFVPRFLYAADIGVPFDETEHLGREWFKDDDD